MENIQNKSALIPSDEIRSEELLAEQKFEAFITSLAHIIELSLIHISEPTRRS